MSVAVVNGVLARCLVDPPFLEAMSLDAADALKAYQLRDDDLSELLALDLRQVRKLAGFIAKVQNNHLWIALPGTRALLAYYGLELDVFTAYHAAHQSLRAGRGHSRREKIQTFIEYLSGYFAMRPVSDRAGLADVFRHEARMWDAQSALEGQKRVLTVDLACPKDISADFPQLRPIAQVPMWIERYEVDPLAIGAMLAEARFDPADLPRMTKFIGYWSDMSVRRVRLMSLEPEVALLLGLVDGSRTVEMIVSEGERLLRSPLDRSEVQQFFIEACGAGLFLLA